MVPKENWAYRALCNGRAKTSPPLVRRFPSQETVEGVMGASLKDPAAQFGMVAPSCLLQSVVRNSPDETAEWADYWRERYGV